MLDHIGLRTTQFGDLVRFYETALAPLGYAMLFAWHDSAGFGRDGVAAQWIVASKVKPTGVHIAVRDGARRGATSRRWGDRQRQARRKGGLSSEPLCGLRHRSRRQQPRSG